MYPATSKTSKYILHHLQSKQQNTSGTAACILLPSSQSKLHSQSLQHMTLLKEYPADAPIFTSTNQSTPTSVPYPLQLWYDAPLPLPPAICSVTAPSKMCFVAKANGRLCTAMLDTGASDIFIDKSFAERHSLPIQPCTRSCQIADGTSTPVIGMCSFTLNLDGKLQQRVQALVLPGLVEGVQLLIGESWLTAHQAELSYQSLLCKVRYRGKPYVLRPQQPDMDPFPPDKLIRMCLLLLRRAATVRQPISAHQASKAIRKGARAFLVRVTSASDQAGGYIEPSCHAAHCQNAAHL